MKNEFIALIILFLLVSCQSRQQVTENISTIDSILQVNVTSLLENKLSELDALSGQAIVMEVQSGQIKALVGLTKKRQYELPTMRELLCMAVYWSDASNIAIGSFRNW